MNVSVQLFANPSQPPLCNITCHLIFFMYTYLCHTCLPMIPPNRRIHYDPTGSYTL